MSFSAKRKRQLELFVEMLERSGIFASGIFQESSAKLKENKANL